MSGIGIVGRINSFVDGAFCEIDYRAMVTLDTASPGGIDIEITTAAVIVDNGFVPLDAGRLCLADKLEIDNDAATRYRDIRDRALQEAEEEDRRRDQERDDEEDRLIANDDTRLMIEEREAANDDRCDHA